MANNNESHVQPGTDPHVASNALVCFFHHPGEQDWPVGDGDGDGDGEGDGDGSGETLARRFELAPGATGLPDEFEHDATINPIAAQAAAAVMAVANRLALIDASLRQARAVGTRPFRRRPSV